MKHIKIEYPYEDWWVSQRPKFLKKYGECILILKRKDIKERDYDVVAIFDLDYFDISLNFALENDFIHQICQPKMWTFTRVR